MRYLKRFNESSNEIIQDCKDILIDLSDDNIDCDFYITQKLNLSIKSKYHEVLIFKIGDNNKEIDLNKYSDNFERLFEFLDSMGYELTNNSYYQHGDWDLYKTCPNCKSENVSRGTCRECNYEGYESDFLTYEHPLTKDGLIYSIKFGDTPEYIYLEFKKI